MEQELDEWPFASSRLRIARGRRGLKQKEVAAMVGVSAGAVSRYEAGTLTPSPETAERIAEALKFPVKFFYAEEIDLLPIRRQMW